MAVLARVNINPQQRYDYQHAVADQSFNAADFRMFSLLFSGLSNNFVVRGLELLPAADLNIIISVANSILLTPLMGSAAFYVALQDADNEILRVPSNSRIFIEAYIERATDVPVTTAQWDPGAVTAQNTAGTEFTSSLNFQEYAVLKFRFSTNAFSPSAIPVATVTTDASRVVDVSDSRNNFFRLATGGALPNHSRTYEWSDTRDETNPIGLASALGTPSLDNPYYYRDGTGARNDKAISSLKEWMDAVMTVIGEIKGTPYWYTKPFGFSASSLYFDSLNGSSPVPKEGLGVEFDQVTQRIKSVVVPDSDFHGPVTWASNYGNFEWNLGGEFDGPVTAFGTDYNRRSYKLSPTDGTLFSHSLNITDPDASKAADSCAVALKVDRETLPLGTYPSSVKWGIGTLPVPFPYTLDQCVFGDATNFTGVAIGDYIRKISAPYLDYVKVVGFSKGDANIVSADGAIADDSITLIIIDTPITQSSELYLWMRANYSESDIYHSWALDKTKMVNSSGVSVSANDASLQFLGRRYVSSTTQHFYWKDIAQYANFDRFGNDAVAKHTMTVNETLRVGSDSLDDSSTEDLSYIKTNMSIAGDNVVIGNEVSSYDLFGDRVLVSSGRTGVGSDTNSLDYFSISAPLTVTSTFGTIGSGVGNQSSAAVSNTVKALFAGSDSLTSTIKSVNTASLGHAFTFGSLIVPRYGMSGISSSYRGIFCGGETGAFAKLGTCEHVSMASNGNAALFGSLTLIRSYSAAVSDGCRGVVLGGAVTGTLTTTDVADYFSIASAGNATVYKSILGPLKGACATSNGIKALLAGGMSDSTTYTSTMEAFNIASNMYSVASGSLTTPKAYGAASSDGTTAVFVGGQTDSVSLTTTIDSVTIASGGNAAAFSNLSVAKSYISAAAGE